MDLGSFLALLDPAILYKGGINFSRFIGMTITPVLLVMAIWLRITKTQLETISGSGKWGLMVKDMAFWVTIIGLYFGIADLLTDMFNVMYGHFENRGSYSKTMEQFRITLMQIDEASEKSDFNGVSLLSAPVTAFAFLIYYISYLIVAFVVKFLSLAHALSYSFAIAWGLIALPLTITSSIKLLRGWAVFLGTILLWPLVHYSAFAFFDPMFVSALDSFTQSDFSKFDQAQLYGIMTIVNALMFAVTLAAPFLAMALVSNSGSISGIVTPFAAAAVAAGGAMAKQSVDRFKASPQMMADGARALGKMDRYSANSATIRPESLGAGGGRSGTNNEKDSTSIKSESASASTDSSNSSSSNATAGGDAKTSTSHSSSDNSVDKSTAGSSAEQSKPSSNVKKAAVSSAMSASASGADEALTENTPEVEEDVQKRKQAKRGAIINNNTNAPRSAK